MLNGTYRTVENIRVRVPTVGEMLYDLNMGKRIALIMHEQMFDFLLASICGEEKEPQKLAS